MMVAALCFTACGGDDGDETGGGGSSYSGEKQVSVYLQQAGTLFSQISKTQASNLLRLKVSGHMDARDFDFIKWDCMKVEEVDLSEVVIDSYSGLEGTEEGNNKTYAANEIPSGAFFYWRDVHKYIYDGMPIEKGKESLKKVVLPQGITAIRRNAFAGAINLTKINIPEGVESIDLVAFNYCTKLEELRLPSTLTNVGKWVFANMNSLKKVYISALVPPTASDDIFENKPSDAVLYVPNGTENLYKYASGWRYFSNIVGGDSGDDDETDGGGSTSSFTITYDGEKNEVENVEWLNPHYGNGGYDKGNYFCLESYPLGNGQIHIIFPYSQYGMNVPPSYFQVGYNEFGEDATDIEYITTSMSGWHGENVSGSAKVVKNSGSSITLQFSNYMFEVSRSGKTHEFILNGTLEFKNYLYD